MSARKASEVLVVVDVGNTNTVFGIYRGDDLVADFRLSTDTERTADEYGAMLLPLFGRAGIDPASASAVIVSSVVPPLNTTLSRLSAEFFGRPPLYVEPGIRTGMPIRYDNPA
ncbi:MAG: type III pantothenate kinase, partial [Thermoanaerobaculia bacterium]